MTAVERSSGVGGVVNRRGGEAFRSNRILEALEKKTLGLALRREAIEGFRGETCFDLNFNRMLAA